MRAILPTVAAISILATAAPADAQELRMADLGACALESGETIDPCHLGYRIVGTPRPDGGNVVVLGTWFSGTSEHLAELIGTGGVFPRDGMAYVVIDAPGNGVSISPSNSPTQPGNRFPDFTIRDMAEMHHRVVAESIGLPGVRAVGGISMGGMTALQWGALRPDYMAQVFSIAGTPWISPSDRTLWSAFHGLVRLGAEWIDERAIRTFSALLRVVAAGSEEGAAADWVEFLRMLEMGIGGAASAPDWAAQLRALLQHDITAGYEAPALAAGAIEAEMMLVVGPRDGVVDPDPSRAFAEIAGARLVELDPRCGHAVHLCDGPGLRAAMRDFLR